MSELRLIDLFSGAGGLSAGFCRLSHRPYRSVWANDFNAYAAATYNANFGDHCTHGDIVDILQNPATTVPQADVVVGGPPCQGFSLLNKNRTQDPRKSLWIPFMEVVRRSDATAFVMENVPQLLGSLEYEEIVQAAENRGFHIWSGILAAVDYGVPQLRRRAFIVGARDVDPKRHFPPTKTHHPPDTRPSEMEIALSFYAPNAAPWRTVRDAISDLPEPQGTEIRNEPAPLDLHFGRNPTAKSIARYQAIPEEGMNRFDLQRLAPELTPQCWIRKTKGGTDLFGRLWWEKPAFTIRTEFFKPEKGRYLHPCRHRPITHREAARIQTFPDQFTFTGTKIEIARQIGNAVPPMLAAAVADRLYQMLLVPLPSERERRLPAVEATRDNVPRSQQEHTSGAGR